ncbi:hypothetical protein GH741_17875 [Aquibacillus halophilus]|uniref:Uncharacterized protein n=1 Tax=Aquibacillus halophilus TaxID=930132 RepID=A0A6A8DJ68_9BACI|nr:hypothetical protein [Aquibacillus halophilus]MRH44516.1 hypothetical protein [Aquibacillus halophilus]
MTKRSENVEQDPHFDGEQEGIISDPVGKEIGIKDVKNNSANPFHVKSLKKDPEMEKFNRTLK